MGQSEGALHNAPEPLIHSQPHGNDLNQVEAEVGRDNIVAMGHQNNINVYNQTIPSQLIWGIVIILVFGIGILGIQLYFSNPTSNPPPKVEEQKPDPPKLPETTYLRGVVETLDGTVIEGAEVEIDRLPGQKVKTTTNGDFSIQNIPGKFGEQIRIYVKCPGYMNRDEYTFLPGPVRIRLEKKR